MTEAAPQGRQTSGLARTAYGLNAGLAWLGVGLTLVISALGGYEPTPVTGNLYGTHPEGFAGAISRVSDTLSYFTIWSNVVVALALTLLARQAPRDSTLRRVLRLDSLLMITITAIVYAVLLAPSAVVVGWSRLTDPILHQVTPAVTVLVWLAFGPRRWISWRILLSSMVIPLGWIAWMLGRGAVVGAYPYDFADVGTRGYPAVAATLAGILVFGVVVGAVFWGIDAAISRATRGSRPIEADQPRGTSS
ncbi:MAG: Pr6Pr family membrane protein [Ornithinibacter sp.]